MDVGTDESTPLHRFCTADFALLAALFSSRPVTSWRFYTEEEFVVAAKRKGVPAIIVCEFLAQTLSDGRTLESFLASAGGVPSGLGWGAMLPFCVFSQPPPKRFLWPFSRPLMPCQVFLMVAAAGVATRIFPCLRICVVC